METFPSGIVSLQAPRNGAFCRGGELVYWGENDATWANVGQRVASGRREPIRGLRICPRNKTNCGPLIAWCDKLRYLLGRRLRRFPCKESALALAHRLQATFIFRREQRVGQCAPRRDDAH